MAKKRLFFPIIGFVIYLLVMLIMDNKSVLMELEDRCPASAFDQCTEQMSVKVKIQKERFRIQRDLFLSLSSLLSLILVIVVAYYKTKVMRINAQLQEAKFKLNKLDPNYGKEPQDVKRNSEKLD